MNIKNSESDNIIYDSNVDDAIAGLNDPYLQIFFSTCTIGSSQVSVCVTTLYFTKQDYTNASQAKTTHITNFYKDAIESLNTGKSKTYPLYYYMDESTSLQLGQVEIKATWSNKSEYEAQIDATITNLCQGSYKSVCTLKVSKTGEIEHLIMNPTGAR